MDLVSKLMSPLFNTLSRFVIAFLPRSKCFLISWLQSPSPVIMEKNKIEFLTVSIVSPSICHEMMGLDLIERVPDKLWMEVREILQKIGRRSPPRKRNAKKQNGCVRRSYKEL